MVQGAGAECDRLPRFFTCEKRGGKLLEGKSFCNSQSLGTAVDFFFPCGKVRRSKKETKDPVVDPKRCLLL